MSGIAALQVSEGIADEALRLIKKKHGLPENFALTWASARVNQLIFLTAEFTHVQRKEAGVVVVYARR